MAANNKKRQRGKTGRDEHRYTVRGVRRDPVDIPKLSRALIGLALAEAEREAQADHAATTPSTDISEAASPRDGSAHG